jgi:hypothetical protein
MSHGIASFGHKDAPLSVFLEFVRRYRLVRDYLRPLGEEVAFHDAVKHGFAGTGNYEYARELRNAVVLRGFDPAASGHDVGKAEVLEAIRDATAMPDWAKAMAHKAISEMDYDRIAAEIAANRIKQIKTFLGC